MTGKLKIGVLIDGLSLQTWQYSVIAGLRNSDHADIKFIVTDRSPAKQKAREGLNPVIGMHVMLDSMIFGRNESYARPKDVSGLVKDVPVISAGKTAGGEWLFDDQEISEVRKYEPDIILSLSSGHLKGEPVMIPRLGVWYFPMFRKNGNSGLPAGYREVVLQEPVTPAILAVTGQGNGYDRVLGSSFESTCSYSVRITGNKIFWRSSLFIFRVLAGLQENGMEYLDALAERNRLENKTALTGYRIPGPAEAAGNLFRNVSITVRKMIRKVFYTDAFSWILRIGHISQDALKPFETNFAEFTTVRPPKGKFWADPFVISEGNKIHVFVEEFIYRKNRAHLAVLTLDRDGNYLGKQVVLEKPYHLSYPFIFKYENDYFMIPESSENRTIDLYRCTHFPDRWVFVKTIMKDLKAVDTTLYEHSGKWWLFTVIDETDGISGCETELFLFYSDSPFSDEWVSHPMNPVVADSRKARPAGKMFENGGRIFRPSQDCSVRYGNSLNLNEVTELSETGYREKEIFKNKPAWDKNLRGMHTFNMDEGIGIIDAYYYHRRNIFDFFR